MKKNDVTMVMETTQVTVVCSSNLTQATETTTTQVSNMTHTVKSPTQSVVNTISPILRLVTTLSKLVGL